jgi:glycosyltransferase involved in cell wall biosynthesis
MRICHVITRLLNAGAEENTILSCNGQAALGHEVHLIYGKEVAQEKLDILHPSVVLHQVHSLVRNINPFADLSAYFVIKKCFRQIQPEIVHTHTSKAGFIGRMAAAHAAVPVVIHGVHMLAFEQVKPFAAALYLEMERIAAKHTDMFINVSEGTKIVMLKHHLGDASNHVVIPSGMDIKKFQQATKFVEPWQDMLPKGTVLPTKRHRFVVYVGAFEPRKRHIEFLQMFKHITKACHHAVLLLCGEGEYEIPIRRAVVELGLEQHVVFMGFRKDIERILPLARLGVLSSSREGLARVLIQYTLAGLPIVATHTPGAEVIVEHEKNGFLVPLEQVHAMDEPLLRLLTDDTLHEQMSEAARNKNLSAWSADHMVDEIEAVYERFYPKPKRKPRKIVA